MGLACIFQYNVYFYTGRQTSSFSYSLCSLQDVYPKLQPWCPPTPYIFLISHEHTWLMLICQVWRNMAAVQTAYWFLLFTYLLGVMDIWMGPYLFLTLHCTFVGLYITKTLLIDTQPFSNLSWFLKIKPPVSFTYMLTSSVPVDFSVLNLISISD